MLTGMPRLLYATALLLGILSLTWAAFRLMNRRVAAHEAVAELAECKRIAMDIEAARTSPKTALLEKQSDQQISSSIQLAAQVAEIPDKDILRINPLQGRRLAKSAHIEQPIDIEIRQVTFGQLSRFLAELSAAECGLKPASLHLTAPRTTPDEGSTELWGCDLVLSYRVFSPD